MSVKNTGKLVQKPRSVLAELATAIAILFLSFATANAECENKKGNTEKNAATGADYLSQFSAASSSDNSTTVTAHIARVVAPAWLVQDKPRTYAWNAVGFDLSTSTPVASANSLDYVKQALLELRGGIANLDVSFFAGRDLCNPVFSEWEPRRLAFDHWYPKLAGGDIDAQLHFYVLNGLGLRAVKTALDGKGYVGVGTAYLGFGFDGPLIDGADSSQKSPPGWMTFEVSALYNVANLEAVKTLLGAPSAPRSYASATANLTMSLPGSFFIALEYSTSLSSFARDYLGDVTVIRFGYNLKNGEPKGGAAPVAK